MGSGQQRVSPESPSGIWTDISANNIIIANNRIYRNEEWGIEIEISSNITVRDNVLFANGWVRTPPDVFSSGGIYILDSANVKIYRNGMAWNRDGFAYIGGNRQNVNAGIEIHDNDMHVPSSAIECVFSTTSTGRLLTYVE